MLGSVSKDTRCSDGGVMALTMWLETPVSRCMDGGWDPPMYLDVDDMTEILVCPSDLEASIRHH